MTRPPHPLALWRRRSGLTAEALAVQLGIHLQTIRRWESAASDTEPPPYLWLALAALEENLPWPDETPVRVLPTSGKCIEPI